MSLDLLLCEAVRGVLVAALPQNVFVGIVHDKEHITFPAVLLGVTSQSLVNSPLWTATIIANTGNQADDSTQAEHAALAAQVNTIISAMVLNGPDVKTLGLVVSISSENQNTERHWVTSQTFKLGFGPH